MMNATNSSDDTTAAALVSAPEISARPMTISSAGSAWPTVGDDGFGEQVVGADGADAARSVTDLEQARDEPDPADNQACEGAEPLCHRAHHPAEPRRGR